MGPVCEAYISAGLPPERFWQITPRLLALEMAGAQRRLAREREMVWFSAMMPHLKTPPSLQNFVGRVEAPAERAARFHAAWDKVDRALSRKAGAPS